MDKFNVKNQGPKECLTWVIEVRCELAVKLAGIAREKARRRNTGALYVAESSCLFKESVPANLKEMGTKQVRHGPHAAIAMAVYSQK